MSQKVTGYSYTLSTAGITKYELRSTTRYTYIHVVCTYNKIINEINLLDLSLRLLHCAHLHFYNNRVLRTTRRHYVLYNMCVHHYYVKYYNLTPIFSPSFAMSAFICLSVHPRYISIKRCLSFNLMANTAAFMY
jgi:hypothetical protein